MNSDVWFRTGEIERMSVAVEYLSGKASAGQVADHLLRCDADFVPPLSERVEINEYARKIVSKAIRFEAWSGDTLVGLLAVYYNDQIKRAYITSVSVLRAWTSNGIATHLVGQCIEHMKVSDMRQVSLEVANGNAPAIKLYMKNGFAAGKASTAFLSMSLSLNNEESMNSMPMPPGRK